MENTIIYKINYSKTPFNIDRISELLSGWLEQNKLDIIITDFNILDEASIIIDYSFNTGADVAAIKELTEMFFNRLRIEYELEEY